MSTTCFKVLSSKPSALDVAKKLDEADRTGDLRAG
jgi:hypothetical protein